jgi:acetyl-CoA carboxylase carboxyl transferase subunit alpha
MFEHSVYTVASPEACAAILWKDAGKAPQAAEALRITATDLQDLGILDEILSEPNGGAHASPLVAAATLKQALVASLDRLSPLPAAERRERRYQKFREIGVFLEATT